MSQGFSLVQDCGTYQSSCGYCKHVREDSRAHGKHSHGMHAHNLTVEAYQELIDQGWRRSGTFLYKPDNVRTCCKQYTIRLHVPDFSPSKSQRKLLRKWDRYLSGEHVGQEGSANAERHMELDVADAQQDASSAAATQQISTPGQVQAVAVAAAGSDNVARFDRDSKRSRMDSLGSTEAGNSSRVGQSSACGGDAAAVQALLQRALEELVAEGRLPKVPYAPIKVQPLLAKQLKALPSGVCLTSPAALAVSGIARKQRPQQAAGLQAADVADALAASFNAHATAGTQPQCSFRAVAMQGHINFRAQEGGDRTPSDPSPMAADTPASTSQRKQQEQQQQQQQQQLGQQHVQHNPQQHTQLQRPADSAAAINTERRASHAAAAPSASAAGAPHSFEIRMAPSAFIKEEFELYCKYQIAQHGDEPQELRSSSYKRFLVDSPLMHVPPPSASTSSLAAAAAAGGETASQDDEEESSDIDDTDGSSSNGSFSGAECNAGGSSEAGVSSSGSVLACGYGSFHQQYWLDGKLVAVGVVDVLPRCLSSVYLFWDPELAHLAPGKFSALKEIEWVANAAKQVPELCYYYMGYYIHSCPKMRYKADYHPSELLCPEGLVWVTIDDTLQAALDAQPYVAFSRLPGARVQPNLSVPAPLPHAQQVVHQTQLQERQSKQQQTQPKERQQGNAGEQRAASQDKAQTSSAGVVSSGDGWSVQAGAHVPPAGSLDEQLTFAFRQPLPWGVLKQAGVLNVQNMEQQLLKWMAVVGRTCRQLVYLLPNDLQAA